MKGILSIIMVCLVALGGCQTIYPDCQDKPVDSLERQICQLEVRQERRLIDKENWNLCQLAYRQNNVPVWHIDHSGEHRVYNPMHIKMDLKNNSCKVVLRDHWAPY